MQVNEKKLEKENMNLKNLINEKENERNQMEINFTVLSKSSINFL